MVFLDFFRLISVCLPAWLVCHFVWMAFLGDLSYELISLRLAAKLYLRYNALPISIYPSTAYAGLV
jgi:hypothetical protein